MGSSISLNNTIVGESLLNQTFKTKIVFYHTQFMNCGIFENRAFLKQYPIVNTKQYLIPQNTIFTINNVEQVNDKFYIYIQTDIFAEIPLIIIININANNVNNLFIFDSIDLPITINKHLITSI